MKKKKKRKRDAGLCAARKLRQKLNWLQRGNSGILFTPGDLLQLSFVGIWGQFYTVSINTVVSVSLPNQLPFSPQEEARDQTEDCLYPH